MPPVIDLTTKTDQELSEWFGSVKGRTEYEFLAKIELQRRLINAQHKFNKESVQLASKHTGTWTLIGAITGAIVTALIGALLSYLSK